MSSDPKTPGPSGAGLTSLIFTAFRLSALLRLQCRNVCQCFGRNEQFTVDAVLGLLILIHVQLYLKGGDMTERPALSKGELEVARVLWELGKASVREVHEAFPAARQMDFTTVQTYLRRLETKGYIVGRLDGRTRIYTPKVQARKVIGETVDDLIERLFGGDTLPLMRHLIEDRGLSDQDLVELRKLIDRLEQEG